jgi:hypothetical protein
MLEPQLFASITISCRNSMPLLLRKHFQYFEVPAYSSMQSLSKDVELFLILLAPFKTLPQQYFL